MTTVKEIEKAIAGLPPEKFSIVRSWINKIDDARWDKQIRADIKLGKLDTLAAKVRENYKNGKCKEL